MWFEIRPVIAPDEKTFRKAVTKKYGIVALWGAFAFIASLAVINYLVCKYIGRRNRWMHTKLQLYVDTRARFVRGAQRLVPSFVRWPVSLTMVLWTVGLAYVLFKDTHHDLTFLVKRLGRIAVALMPPLYFLTLRPTPLPYTFYLQLLPFHKWLSRVTVVLSVLHGLVYWYIYLQTNKTKKLYKLANVSGIVAGVGFVALGLTSLPRFRRAFYSAFYTIHYTLAWICMVLVACHASPPAYSYMAGCAAILVFQIIFRLHKTGHTRLPVQFISDSLYMVSIPFKQLPPNLRQSFTPGAHVRISSPIYDPRTWLRSSHPYTVASLPHEDHLKLVIRKTQYPIKLRQVYSVYGPFNSLPNDFMNLARSGQITRALLVMGGSGIAFGAPVFRFLKTMGVRVKLLWAIKDIREISVLTQLGLADDLPDIEIYISPRRVTSLGLRKQMSLDIFLHSRAPNEDENLDVAIEDEYCAGSESSPLMTSRQRSYDSMEQNVADLAPNVFNHRLTLNNRLKYWLCGLTMNENECSCLDYMMVDIKPHHTSGTWVISSGANNLVNEAKCWANNNNFQFFQEEFAL